MPESIDADNTNSEIQDGAPNSIPADPAVVKSNSKKPFIIAIVFVVSMIIFGIGAAAYNTLVLNNPDKIWEQALQNTSDSFVEVSRKLQESPYTGGTIEGTFELTAPVAANGAINGVWYEKNAKLNGNVNISGIETSGEIRVVAETDSNKSNTYIKLEGLENAATFLSLVQPELVDVVAAINGIWYVIDDAVMPEASSGADDIANSIDVSPEELAEITNNVSTILNERLFTADESKAVIIVNEAVGREDFEGDDTYKYNVKLQKQQFVDFINALKDTIEQTDLQGVFTQDISGVDDAENFSDTLDQINEIDFDNLQAEAWVDMENKYFRNVRIPISDDTAGVNGYIDFGLDYEGGDELPFSVRLVSDTKTDSSNELINALFEASLNKDTTALGLGFTVVATVDGSQINATSSLLLKPSDQPVEVDVPENIQNISDLFGLLMSQDASVSPFEEFESNSSSYQLDDVEL